MKCYECGKKIKKDDDICPNCGVILYGYLDKETNECSDKRVKKKAEKGNRDTSKFGVVVILFIVIFFTSWLKMMLTNHVDNIEKEKEAERISTIVERITEEIFDENGKLKEEKAEDGLSAIAGIPISVKVAIPDSETWLWIRGYMDKDIRSEIEYLYSYNYDLTDEIEDVALKSMFNRLINEGIIEDDIGLINKITDVIIIGDTLTIKLDGENEYIGDLPDFENGFIKQYGIDEVGYIDENGYISTEYGYLGDVYDLKKFPNLKNLEISLNDFFLLQNLIDIKGSNIEKIALRGQDISSLYMLGGIDGELESVIELDISYNNIREISDSEIVMDRFPNLKNLTVKENNVETIDEGDIDYYSSIESLDLSDNYIEDIWPLYVLNLKYLNLARNNFVMINGIEEMILLERLDLSGNVISDVMPLTIMDNLNYVKAVDSMFFENKESLDATDIEVEYGFGDKIK